MGKSYQFYCLSCELNIILYEGIKKGSEVSSVNYYCFKCNKTSNHDQCAECGEKLYYTMEIPKEQNNESNEEENLLNLSFKCPRCGSKDTIFIFMGEWE